MYTTKEGKAGRNKIKFPYWFLVELFFDYVNTSSACVFSAILKQGAKHRRSMNHVRTPAMILNWLFSHLSRVFFADASQTSQLNMLQFSAMHKIYTWNQSILVGRFKACLFSANLSFQWGACVVHSSWFYLMMTFSLLFSNCSIWCWESLGNLNTELVLGNLLIGYIFKLKLQGNNN